MKRIFLLIENFTELTFLETLLKKVGFDTLGSQNAVSALERAMLMTPEVFILSDIIKSHSTHDVMDAFKKYKPNIQVVLLKKDLKYQTPHNLQLVEATVRSPIDPEVFLRTVAQIAKVNEDLVIEKFHKLGLFKGIKSSDDKIVIHNQVKSEDLPAQHVPSGKAGLGNENQFVKSLDDETRNESKFVRSLEVNIESHNIRKLRFKKQLETLPEPKVTTVDHKIAMKEMQDFRNREQDPEIKNIDEARKNFVIALFKKN